MLPIQPLSYTEESYAILAFDFSQNSMVVMDFTINHMWKLKKAVMRMARKIPKVSPKSKKNMVRNGVVL